MHRRDCVQRPYVRFETVFLAETQKHVVNLVIFKRQLASRDAAQTMTASAGGNRTAPCTTYCVLLATQKPFFLNAARGSLL
jgi:hypothetical protein